jgi:hypothetical protein
VALLRSVVIVALLGCTPHVPAPTVPASLLPVEQRMTEFMQLRAVAEENVWATRCTHKVGCSDELEDKALYLANGTRVDEPEQLLPFVAETSDAARAARNAAHARSRAKTWFAVAVGALVGSVAVAAKTGDATLGFALGLPGVLVPAALTWHHTAVSIEQAVVAHDRYNEGLAARLSLCINRLIVAPCESQPISHSTPTTSTPRHLASTSPVTPSRTSETTTPSQRATALAANRVGM